MSAASPTACPIVAIGASAGGLKALEQLFDATPANPGMAFVIVTHLAPNHKSHMAELLTRHSAMPVTEVLLETATPVLVNHIYIIPPNRFLSISGAGLHAIEPGSNEPVRMPIDRFLSALAKSHHTASIAIILSGSGSDGTLGLTAIKAHGGLVIAQEPRSASHDSMPRNAIETGLVDYIATPADMPAYFIPFASFSSHSAEELLSRLTPALVTSILNALKAQDKQDFSGYKTATLKRRIARRMDLCHVTDAEEYLSLLENNDGEADALVSDFMIGVTHFFRDKEAFDELKEQVIQPLLETRSTDESLRIWVPGCATGEEAYSIAMMVLEQENLSANPLKLFATDVDSSALTRARAAEFPETIAGDMTSTRLERFFLRENGNFKVKKSVRECVTFALQNVVSHPPFSSIDLISCRNLLIYLTPESQKRVLALFHFALADGGYLFLGSAESVTLQSALFESVSKSSHIFRRRTGSSTASFNFVQPLVQEFRARSIAGTPVSANTSRLRDVTQQLLLKEYGAAAVLINREHDIVFFHGPTHEYLNHHPTGILTANVFAMAGLRLIAKLREAVYQTIETAQLSATQVRLNDDDRDRLVYITVRPVRMPAPAELLYLVTFSAKSEPAKSLQIQGESIDDHSLASQFEVELAAAREDLRMHVEEHASMQEALLTANEEAVSVNEELQSTNEELESSEEELQSLNEELTSVNAQLKEKVDELQLSYDYANSIIETVREPFLVLDQNLLVRSANRSFYEKFSVTPGETLNRLVYELGNHQWDIATLRTLLEEVLPKNYKIENFLVEHTFPNIGTLRFLLNARHLNLPGDAPARILLAFEDITEREGAMQLKRSAETFSRLVDESPFGIYVVDSNFCIARVSVGGLSAFKNVKPLIGRDFEEAIHTLWSEKLANDIVSLFRHTLETGEPYASPGLTAKRLDVGVVESYEWQIHRVTLPDGRYGVVCYFFDSSDIRAAEQAAYDSEQSALRASRAKSEFLAHVSHEIRTPMSAVLGYAELLLNQLKSDEYLDEVKIIKSSGESLLRLVDDLLDLSSIEAGRLQIEPDHCELDVLLAEVVSQVQMRATEKHLNLTLDYAGDIPQSIETDAGRVQQILLNLLSNAIKFTDKGDISLRVVYLAGQAPTVRFDVTDTGIGMSKSRQRKLFQPFERTTRRSYGGTGLGLYISHRLVERLQGTLTVESKLHRGSVFTLTLPAGTRDTVALVKPRKTIVLPKSISELSLKLAGKHILIVDDQPAVRDLLKQFVESASGMVTTANNGQMALNSVSGDLSQPIDAIAMDVQMPIMDGLATVGKLRQRGLTLPIIAITANSLQYSRRQCLSAGFDDYMNKPIVGNVLISTLHQLIKGSAQRRVLVVDDAPESADPLARLLRIRGFDVQTVYDGTSVLAAVEAFSPDVVLLDISLPDMDGYQVADLIQQRSDSDGIELIALTGHDSEADRKAIRKAGFKHHLVKPVDIKQLLVILMQESG